MVKQRMDLLELLRKRGMDGDVDLLREALRVLVGRHHGRRGFRPDRRPARRTQPRCLFAGTESLDNGKSGQPNDPVNFSIRCAGLKSLYNNKMTPAARTCSCLSSHAGGRVLPSTIVGQPGG